jgi:hypothetical protein
MIKPKVCSAAIWRKFRKNEQPLYCELLKRNRSELRLLQGVEGFEGLNKTILDIFSHNLACEAIWVLRK